MRRLEGEQRPWQTPSYNSWRILSVEPEAWQINSRLKLSSLSAISTPLFHTWGETFADATFFETMLPLWSYSSFVARGASSRVAVVIVTSDRAHSELIASPLNPNVSNSSRFSKVEILEV
jgi:hypothetical protein